MRANQGQNKACFYIILSIAVAFCASSFAVHSRRVTSTARQLQSVISAPVQRRSTILFIIDGCQADAFNAMIGDGELPNIKRELVDKGISVRNALTCIPSVTYCGVGSIVTGQYPGRADIVGNNWFDRSKLEGRSYLSLKDFYRLEQDTNATTIFKFLKPCETAAIFTPLTTGASFVRKMDYNYIVMGNYFLRRWTYVDRVYARHIDDVVTFADRIGVFPVLTIIHLPGTDNIGHQHGNQSEEYAGILRNVDDLIGEVINLFERNGVRERMSLIITADHGQMGIGAGNHIDIKKTLKKIGFDSSNIRSTRVMHGKKGCGPWSRKEIMQEDRSIKKRESRYRKYRALYAINGRCAYLYLRKNGSCTGKRAKDLPSWQEKPNYKDLVSYKVSTETKINLPQAIVQQEGVGFVVCKSEEGVEIYSVRGHSRVEARSVTGKNEYRYTIISGEDPLYYDATPCAALLNGGYNDADQWLPCSAGSRYPGVVEQLGSIFQSSRCGDIIIFAEDGWDFEPNKMNAAAHGGFARAEMRIPFLWSGPDIRTGRIEAIESVDIFPTIAEYLGVSPQRIEAAKLDGTSFLHEIISN